MNHGRSAQKKVIIVGGGVGGLSAAHELACRGFSVDVYERKAVFGGKARSIPFQARRDVVLPAEHGFRFFPGFYKHVIATMGEIPTKGGSVADHLVRVSELRAVGDTASNPVLGVLPLEPAWRWSGFVKWAAFLPAIVRSAPGPDGRRLSGEDLAVFASRFWELLSMCRERREQLLEAQPWSEFISGGSRRSDAYQKYLSAGLTRNLVACRADKASALTVGTIGIQLLWDALRGLVVPSGLDRVLDGPTSEVWIEPWVDFLRKQGVTFHSEYELDEIEIADGQTKPWIVSVKFRAPGQQAPLRSLEETERVVSELASQDDMAAAHERLPAMGAGARERRSADYYVFAIPIEQMSTFIDSALMRSVPGWRGLPLLAKSVEWMNGALFYLSPVVSSLPGTPPTWTVTGP